MLRPVGFVKLNDGPEADEDILLVLDGQQLEHQLEDLVGEWPVT